jgi:repressor LexA
MLELYANIKRIREARNMSQDELAKLVGFKSRSSINKIELGINDITQSKLVAIAKALNVSPAELMGNDKEVPPPEQGTSSDAIVCSFRIPVLGRVAAGTPIFADEEIIGYEYIDNKYQGDGYQYFALRIQGHSMEPTIMNGDTVIVRKQETIDSGQIAIVLINGDDATAKEIKEAPGGIYLIGHNVAVYPPRFYSNPEVQQLPIRVIGRVIQSIRRF